MFTADHVLLNLSKSTRSLACKRVLLKCDSVNKELCIRHSWTYLWGITYNLLWTNVQRPHLPWKENQSHRWGTRVEGNSSCLKKTKQSTLHMLEVSHALHAACNSTADTNTTGIWRNKSVTCWPNNKQVFWQQRFNAHHTHSYLTAMGLKKRFPKKKKVFKADLRELTEVAPWTETGSWFQVAGAGERRTDWGSTVDRNRELVPGSWSWWEENWLLEIVQKVGIWVSEEKQSCWEGVQKWRNSKR